MACQMSNMARRYLTWHCSSMYAYRWDLLRTPSPLEALALVLLMLAPQQLQLLLSLDVSTTARPC